MGARLQAFTKPALPKPFALCVERVCRYLNKRESEFIVRRYLSLLALVVSRIVNHAPDLDVPTVSKKIGLRAAVKWQTRFVFMRNAMHVKPVVNTLLVQGSDDVPIKAVNTLPEKAVGTTSDATLLEHFGNRAVRYAVQLTYGSLRKTLSNIQSLQRCLIGQLWGVAITPCVPYLGTRDTVLLQPNIDDTSIRPVLLADFSIAEMLDMDHTVKFLSGRRRSKATGLQSIVGRPARNIVLAKPAFDTHMTNVKMLCDLSSGKAFRQIQVFEHRFRRTGRWNLLLWASHWYAITMQPLASRHIGDAKTLADGSTRESLSKIQVLESRFGRRLESLTHEIIIPQMPQNILWFGTGYQRIQVARFI